MSQTNVKAPLSCAGFQFISKESFNHLPLSHVPYIHSLPAMRYRCDKFNISVTSPRVQHISTHLLPHPQHLYTRRKPHSFPKCHYVPKSRHRPSSSSCHTVQKCETSTKLNGPCVMNEQEAIRSGPTRLAFFFVCRKLRLFVKFYALTYFPFIFRGKKVWNPTQLVSRERRPAVTTRTLQHSFGLVWSRGGLEQGGSGLVRYAIGVGRLTGTLMESFRLISPLLGDIKAKVLCHYCWL